MTLKAHKEVLAEYPILNGPPELSLATSLFKREVVEFTAAGIKIPAIIDEIAWVNHESSSLGEEGFLLNAFCVYGAVVAPKSGYDQATDFDRFTAIYMPKSRSGRLTADAGSQTRRFIKPEALSREPVIAVPGQLDLLLGLLRYERVSGLVVDPILPHAYETVKICRMFHAGNCDRFCIEGFKDNNSCVSKFRLTGTLTPGDPWHFECM